MAKKLRKKIEELCGLTKLEYGDRRAKAEDILASNDWKHELCNDLTGLSFRDLEKTLKSILAEREVRDDSYSEKLRSLRTVNKTANMAHNVRPTSIPKPPQRTLDQILAQAYGPRNDQSFSKEEVKAMQQFTRMARPPDLHEGTMHEDSESEQ